MDELLKSELEKVGDALEGVMHDILPEVKERVGERRLAKAMRYSAMSDGKRLRPFLVVATSRLFGVSEYSALHVAAAVELVHAFSLVHDDLPALDDDDMRRGKPSCHKKYDEATAILAGDALLALAFEVLSHEVCHVDAKIRCQLMQALSKAVGVHGMIGGQMIDLISEERDLNIDEVTRLQRMKTGALFAVSCELGAILGKATTRQHNALRGYANDIGLAFQITDDLLDVESDSADDRQDKSANKGTLISTLGVDKAKRQSQILVNQALLHLEAFGSSAEVLRSLARFIIDRQH